VDVNKIYGYPHNENPHGYKYEYEMNVYSLDRVEENYRPYLIYHVDIPKHTPYAGR